MQRGNERPCRWCSDLRGRADDADDAGKLVVVAKYGRRQCIDAYSDFIVRVLEEALANQAQALLDRIATRDRAARKRGELASENALARNALREGERDASLG